MSLPLEGITVLDLTRLLPGNYCTTMLADLGARVIKVEEPKVGDYGRWEEPFYKQLSFYHLILNRNKESVRLNLKHPKGVEVFRKLAAEADVVIEAFRPGVADRLGIGYDSLRAIRPSVVYCSLSGFGQNGPYAQKAGHDLNYLALSGVLSLMPNSEAGVPSMPGIFVGDLMAASWTAYAIMAGLRKAEKTGAGEYIDVSIHDVAVSLLSLAGGRQLYSGSVERVADMTGSMACYNVFETKDGRHASLGAFEPHFWRTFCDAVGREDLKPFDLHNQEEREGVLVEVRALFKSRTLAEWCELLEGHDVCFAPVKNVAEALADPHVRARGMLFTQEHPTEGPVQQIAHPVKYREVEPRKDGPAPAFGEHTRPIVSGLGYSETELESLVAEGIIGLRAERG